MDIVEGEDWELVEAVVLESCATVQGLGMELVEAVVLCCVEQRWGMELVEAVVLDVEVQSCGCPIRRSSGLNNQILYASVSQRQMVTGAACHRNQLLGTRMVDRH